MKTVDEPGVEELVQVEEHIGVLVLRVQLQFESREDVAHHHPNDVVEQPRGQVEGVRLPASALSLEKKTRNLLISSSLSMEQQKGRIPLFSPSLEFPSTPPPPR